MPIDLAAVLTLAADCAPQVAPQTLLSIISVESGFEPLAIGINGEARRAIRPASRADAIQTAKALLAAGANLDLGLAQINSKNLEWLGLSVDDAFSPCANLAASAKVLTMGFKRVAPNQTNEQIALRQALSLYNTGDPTRGFRNGYVGKIERAAARLVPAIAAGPASQPAPSATPNPTPPNPEPPSWDVFNRARLVRAAASFVLSPPAGAVP